MFWHRVTMEIPVVSSRRDKAEDFIKPKYMYNLGRVILYLIVLIDKCDFTIEAHHCFIVCRFWHQHLC